MSYRKDFLSVLSGEEPATFPATEYMMFWPECLPEYTAKAETQDLAGYFGLGKIHNIPFDFNPYPAFEEEVLEETETHITKVDGTGVTLKLEKGTSAMPHYIDFPIKCRESYELFAKRLVASDNERYAAIPQFKKDIEGKDALTCLTVRGAFAFLRDFIRFDELMLLFYDDPELIRDMVNTHADFIIEGFTRVFEQIKPDLIYLGEDMAYKNGSMLSGDMIDEFIFPAWKKIIDFCKYQGIEPIILDSDGNIYDILPIAVRAGFTCVLPIERAAGMDGEEIRRLYPNLVMIGGVDKLEIAKGKAHIDKEVTKAVRLYKTGRYIPGIDHSVPPIISFENYSYYISSLQDALKNSISK